MKKLLIVFAGTAMLISCKKPEFSDLQKVKLLKDVNSLEFYSEFPKTENHPYRLFFTTTSAEFGLTYNAMGIQEALSDDAILSELAKCKTGMADGRVKNKDGVFVPQKSVSFENEELKLTDYNYYSLPISDVSLWQKKTIHFRYVSNDDVERKTELYCPDRIILFNPYSVPLSKKEPVKIRWNRDDLNLNGVVLLAEYNSSSGKEVDGFLLEDDGDFVLPLDYVKKIPTGAELEITLQRGNASLIIIGETDSTKVMLQTSSRAIFRVGE